MRWRGVIVLLAALVAAAATARLGWWQLDRAQQKNALQAAVDERLRMPAIGVGDLARNGAQNEAQMSRMARLTGRWADDHTVYLDNRQMGGQTGFVVLTPLKLDDGSAVLVERGWMARDFLDRTKLQSTPSEPGSVVVEGRIVAHPSRLYEFAEAASGVIRQNVDLAAFAREIGLDLRPVSILQTGPQPSTLRRDWPRPSTGVHKNYGYAFQWFALSALILGLYVWYQIIRPQRRVRR